MKRKFLLTICLMLISWSVCESIAAPINVEQARNKALEFYQNRIELNRLTRATTNVTQMKLIQTGSDDATGHPLYYIFNIGDDSAFVITAGDDCIDAVLGYGNNGGFNAEEIPDNMRWWLSEYERQMEYAIKHGLQIHVNSPEGNVVVEPLLISKWGQGSPYNDLCPIGKEGKRCPTGCIATAMAQIMYYHKWPNVGYESHTYSSLVDETLPITQMADFAKTIYQWNLMKDSYTSSESVDSRNAVATLLSNIGISIDMVYNTTGSSPTSAKEASAWKRYFKYKAKSLEDVNDVEFSRIVCQELENNRPVFMCGAAPTSGVAHAFVCDGFSNNGYFHFNWGWTSNYDGYFLLTNMVPAEGCDYSYNHRIVYGIEPYHEPLSLNVRVQTPGTLSMLLDESDIMHISSLKVSGNLNGTDILTLREMAGRDVNNKKTDGILAKLDLSEANIVDGGDCYFKTDDETYYKNQIGTKSNVFPDQSFMSTNLQSIRLPNSIKSVGRYAFIFCHDLTSVDFGRGVESLDFSCFNYTSLSDLIVPDHVKSIGPYAFCNMESLKRVILGSGITRIDRLAFEKDNNIEHICSRISSPFAINTDVFSDECYRSAVLHVADGKASAYRQKSSWQNFRTIVEPTELKLMGKPTTDEVNTSMTIKNLTDRDFYGVVRFQYNNNSYGPGNSISGIFMTQHLTIPGSQKISVVFPYISTESDGYTIMYQNGASDDWQILYQYPSEDDMPQLPLNTHWSQTSPFNDDCPNGAAAGCGAVAVAQILSHYRIPEHGYGRAKYTLSNGTTIDVDFDANPIDWANILNTYDASSPSLARSAVARLVYQVGAAMKMQYGSNSSPANHPSMLWGLQHHMHFSPQSRYRRRLFYSTTEWIEMLNGELEAGHPVFYRGDHTYVDGGMVGHMFVIDGRDDEGCFHFNFGHASSIQDKFTNLNVINQSSGHVIGGTKEHPSTIAYHHRQAMVTDFYPIDGLTENNYDTANLVLTEPIVLNNDWHERTVRANSSILVSFGVRYASFDKGTIQYSIGFSHNGQLAVSPTQRQASFSDGGYYIYVNREFQLPQGLADGDYEMCVVSRTDGDSPWRQCWECAPNRIPTRVENGKFIFDYPNFHNKGACLELEDAPQELEENGERFVEFTVANISDNNFEDTLQVQIKHSGTKYALRPILTSIYGGQRNTYRMPIQDAALTEIELLYKDVTTDSWFPLSNPISDEIDVVEHDEFDGVEVFSFNGALMVRFSRMDVDRQYASFLARIPRGVYIIREKGRSRKFIKR